MAAQLLEVRRLTSPTVTVTVLNRKGQPIGDITGYAFRFNVIGKLEPPFAIPPQTPTETLLITVVPAINTAADATVDIAFAVGNTGFGPGTYQAELIWNESGTDPIFPVLADDFNEYTFRLVDAAELAI
jgi:hypothetical protein